MPLPALRRPGATPVAAVARADHRALPRGRSRRGPFRKLLPRQSRADFFGVLRDSDLLLDTIGFSGFNSTMQAIECELPVVAWEGRYIRGRLASGTLRAMGMDEFVATDKQAYVDTAVRLCRDATYRLKVAARTAEGGELVFRDLAPVRAFEVALSDAVRTSRFP